MAIAPFPFLFTRDEALARAANIDPGRYARTRNFLSGDVTRLSAFITHGMLTIPELLARVHSRHLLSWQDKLVFEFGWREYFHHAWSRLGNDIWREQHAPPASAYADAVPADIRSASTGIAIIDQQITELYATGYLHNHARMWIASYLVHIRKVSWQAGARWMYAHLLDGDLASNTLSWQWVAGTWTGKPYLFNAENVARYAPNVDCSGTVIDTTYEALDAMARSSKSFAALSPNGLGAVIEPAVLTAPPPELVKPSHDSVDVAAWLMHPWSLNLPDDRPAIGVINTDFHALYPWSLMRWQCVMAAMYERCTHILVGTSDELATQLCRTQLSTIKTLNPFYDALIEQVAPDVAPAPRAFANPSMLKRSFTSFWNNVSREKFPV
jgi:deoxyribodipyrimidine photo-lyase